MDDIVLRGLDQEIEHVLRQALSRSSDLSDRRRDAARLAARAREIAAMTPAGVAQTDSVLLIREDRDR
ncbi:hypothetical protein [Methylobacterium nigriterrae]|uniref:hypothetical protein n=1 Tax=Methylobacterium nigriterrae TaxID=3127512 RepID=UPI0030132D7F